MAVTPVLLVKTVTAAGTRVQVTTDTDYKPVAVYFEAFGTNTGNIYIGDSAVSSTNYMTKLSPPASSTTSGGSWSLTSAGNGGRIGGTGIQLSNIWVDSSVSGDKVLVTYMYEVGG